MITRSHKSKKDRQCNGQKKKDKWTNNNLQNTTQKTKGQALYTPQKREVRSGASEGVYLNTKAKILFMSYHNFQPSTCK